MNKLVIAQDAHQRREQFLQLHGISRLMEIKLLHTMWKKKDWEALGFGSLKDFIEAPAPSGGLDISRSWAVQLIQTYQKYVVELKQPEETLIEISPRKLYFLKDTVNEENITKMLSRAMTMTLSELQIEAKGIDTVNCEHPNIESLDHCLDCGTWIKENE